MAKNKQDPEKKEDPKTDPESHTDADPQTTASSKTSTDGTPEGYVTEESYKGIQRTLSKKDEELAKAQEKLDKLSEQLEETKASSASVATDKGNLETQLEETKAALEALQTDRDSLNKQVERQTIIMTEYPQLATLAEYIPHADDADGFKENAEQFAEALGSFVDKGVKAKIAGATDPSPAGKEETTAKETEAETLYNKMAKIAGDDSKLDEFQELQARYEEIMS